MSILDFEKALLYVAQQQIAVKHRFLRSDELTPTFENALESQAQAAVAEVRAEYAPLIEKVREWQEAWKDEEAAWVEHRASLPQLSSDPERWSKAVAKLEGLHATLAALPLPPEVAP